MCVCRRGSERAQSRILSEYSSVLRCWWRRQEVKTITTCVWTWRLYVWSVMAFRIHPLRTTIQLDVQLLFCCCWFHRNVLVSSLLLQRLICSYTFSFSWVLLFDDAQQNNKLLLVSSSTHCLISSFQKYSVYYCGCSGGKEQNVRGLFLYYLHYYFLCVIRRFMLPQLFREYRTGLTSRRRMMSVSYRCNRLLGSR